MAEAQGPTLEEILSQHNLQRVHLDKECSEDMRREVAIKMINWKMIGRHFGIPKEKIAAIRQDEECEEERRVALLETWSRKEGERATYWKLMDALYNNGRGDLVDYLCRRITAATSAPCEIQSQPSEPGINMVQIQIDEFEARFQTLCDQLESVVSEKQVSVRTLLQSITKLPQAFRREYKYSIEKTVPKVEKKKKVYQLFLRLNPLMHFIDYHLLNHLISKFGDSRLKENMRSNIQDVQEFMRVTTVAEVMDYWPGDETSRVKFSKLLVKLKDDPKTYTLERLNQFRRCFCSKIRLSELITSLVSLLSTKSFIAVWLVPTIAVSEIAEAISQVDQAFYIEENILMILLDEKQFYPSDLHVHHHTVSDLITLGPIPSEDQKPSSKSEASSGESVQFTRHSEIKRPTLQRSYSSERKAAEHERIEALAEEICEWLSQSLDVDITPDNFMDKLGTGVELCKLRNKVMAMSGGKGLKKNDGVDTEQNPAKARQNIQNFIEWCKGFIHSNLLFESNDLVAHKGMIDCRKRVLLCLSQVKQRYVSVLHYQTIDKKSKNEKGRVTDETDLNNRLIRTQVKADVPDQKDSRESSDLPLEAEGKNKKKEQEGDSSIEQTAANTDNKSKGSSTTSISNELSEGEASKDKGEENAGKLVSQVTKPNTVDDDDDSHNNPSNFYPLIFLCISIVLFGGFYFLKGRK